MRKFYIILLTVMLAMTLTVSVGATDVVDEPMTEAVTETAETPTETQAETNEEVVTELLTEAETSPAEADTELGALLDGATPEQIENIKQYILYGISTLPLPDQVRAFASEYLDAIAWILAAVAFLLFFIGNRMTKKSLSDTMTVTNNNAVDVAEQAQACVESAVQSMDKVAAAVDKALSVSEEKSAAMLELAKDCTEKTLTVMEERGNEILHRAKETTDAAVEVMTELKARESGLAESEIMLATIIHDLVQNSNLPEWKKDEFTAHLKEGMEKIREVTSHDEA